MAIPSGELYLLSNVPLTATYEHTIDFKDRAEQFNYFRGFVKNTLDNYTYFRKEREFISVELSMSDLDNINYLMFKSSDTDRLYYAFVTNKVYINPHTTQIFYMIDVMQTYQFDYEWKASYIRQSHVDRWTADHKPIYSKTDEGIDYGTEYAIESAYRIEQSSNLRWLLVTLTDYSKMEGLTGHVAEIGYFHPVFSPFACFLVPIVIDTAGTISAYSDVIIENSAGVTGGNAIGKIGQYGELLELMLNSAFGNYIRSISLMTYNPFVESEIRSGENGAITVRMKGTTIYNAAKINEVTFLMITHAAEGIFYEQKTLAQADWNLGIESSLPTSAQWEEIKSKPRTTKRDKRFESKLLCAPYRYNLLTDWRNNPTIFKNEYMTTDKIELKFSFAMSYNVPFRYWIKDYKKDPEGRYTSLSQPIALEMPIISDAYYTYMLENKNTIQANLTNSIISAGAGVINGVVSGAGVGGVGGAVYGGIAGAVGGALNVSAQIRSENAKQSDLRAKPDSIVNSTDSTFNIIDKNTDVTFYRMRICCENEEIIAEIFNMSGYKVNRVEVPNTRSRTRFNYIQTLGANIVGSFSQDDILKIKEIYDRGITIWHYSAKDFNMLDYSYENIEVNLI